MPDISIVTPFHNEADGVERYFARLVPILDALENTWEIIAIDDGSSDGTLRLLINHAALRANIRVFELSRNFGKEAALTCGIENATGRAVVPLDADLQDPPELIGEMIGLWRQGYDVVLARRLNRSNDTWPKKTSAKVFYRLMTILSEHPFPENVGDFRLMDRSVVDALCELHETRRFMKGLFSWVGFRTVTIEFSRPVREVGVSKFGAWRLWNFAIEGITSFSTMPLKIWTYIGFLVGFFAIIYAAYIVAHTILNGIDLPGYPSLLVVILLLAAVQLIGIGVLGEYVGRTYLESKRRPNYIVRRNYARQETSPGHDTPAVEGSGSSSR